MIIKNTEQLKGKRLKKLDLHKDETPFVWSRNRDIVMEQSVEGSKLIESYRIQIDSLTSWCNINDCLIGHIKLFLEDNSKRSVWISTVGEAVMSSSEKFNAARILQYQENITVILFGKNKNEMNEKIKEVFNKMEEKNVNIE